MFGLSSFGSSGFGTSGGGPGNYANLFLPAVTLPAIGIAALALPSFAFSAAGRDVTGERSFVQTLGAPSVVAFGGANAALIAPAPALGITGTFTGFGAAALDGPTPTLAATATTSAMSSAALTFGYNNGGSYTLVGYSGAVCAVTLAGKPTVAASGTAGGISHAATTCPLFNLVASGTAQNYGGANLLAPSARLGATAQAWLMAPGCQLTAIGSAVVTATYEAYSINLTHRPSDTAPVDEVTHYTHFPFTHIVRYRGSYFGAAADGLYLLEGTTDDGMPIEYALTTCSDDLNAPQEKNIASAFLAGRLGANTTVTLHAGEDCHASYAYNTLRGPTARTHREKFGRGVKNYYFAIGLAGKGGLELDSIELEVNKSNRKI